MKVFDLDKFEQIVSPLKNKHLLALLEYEGTAVDPATISRIRNGKIEPNLKLLVVIADIFNKRVDDFLSDNTKESKCGCGTGKEK